MAIAARLELRQGQGLVITPQLQQAIKLLQLSNLELEGYIEGELEKNPLLSRDEWASDGDETLREAPADRAEMSFDDAPGGAAAAELDASSADLHADAAPGDRDAGEVPAGEAGGGDRLVRARARARASTAPRAGWTRRWPPAKRCTTICAPRSRPRASPRLSGRWRWCWSMRSTRAATSAPRSTSCRSGWGARRRWWRRCWPGARASSPQAFSRAAFRSACACS